EDVHHLGVVGPEAVDELALRRTPEGLGAGVDVLVHAPHPERLGRRAVPPGGVEAGEIALGVSTRWPMMSRTCQCPAPVGASQTPGSPASASMASASSRTARRRLSFDW